MWERLAAEADQARAALAAQLQVLQAAAPQTTQATAAIVTQAEAAAAAINIDEAATRVLIDAPLTARGWEADSETIRYGKGTRPTKGRNLAIAEWPTNTGPADYALFVGTKCIGVVEAERRNKNVSAHIDQAERYSRGFRLEGGAEPIGAPWKDGAGDTFKVPFLFSTNGRPYLKQVETQSGTWFRDARRQANHRMALVGWPTPDGLQAKLDIDVDAAQKSLKTTPIEFGRGMCAARMDISSPFV